MGKALHYSSHLPVLLRALAVTDGGPVLELGTGLFSTPVLHWACAPTERRLVSLESDAKYLAFARQFETPWHEVRAVTDWDAADIEHPWDVVLVDHAPEGRRKEDIRRLAPHARLVVVHDTCGRDESHYHYREVFPLYRYAWQYARSRPRTTVLSNTMDVARVIPRW